MRTGSPSSEANSSPVSRLLCLHTLAIFSISNGLRDCSPRTALLRPPTDRREATVQQRVRSRDATQGGVCARSAGEGGTEESREECAEHASHRRCRHAGGQTYSETLWHVALQINLSSLLLYPSHASFLRGGLRGSIQTSRIASKIR
jgi:hypothetical protein